MDGRLVIKREPEEETGWLLSEQDGEEDEYSSGNQGGRAGCYSPGQDVMEPVTVVVEPVIKSEPLSPSSQEDGLLGDSSGYESQTVADTCAEPVINGLGFSAHRPPYTASSQSTWPDRLSIGKLSLPYGNDAYHCMNEFHLTGFGHHSRSYGGVFGATAPSSFQNAYLGIEGNGSRQTSQPGKDHAANLSSAMNTMVKIEPIEHMRVASHNDDIFNSTSIHAPILPFDLTKRSTNTERTVSFCGTLPSLSDGALLRGLLSAHPRTLASSGTYVGSTSDVHSDSMRPGDPQYLGTGTLLRGLLSSARPTGLNTTECPVIVAGNASSERQYVAGGSPAQTDGALLRGLLSSRPLRTDVSVSALTNLENRDDMVYATNTNSRPTYVSGGAATNPGNQDVLVYPGYTNSTDVSGSALKNLENRNALVYLGKTNRADVSAGSALTNPGNQDALVYHAKTARLSSAAVIGDDVNAPKTAKELETERTTRKSQDLVNMGDVLELNCEPSLADVTPPRDREAIVGPVGTTAVPAAMADTLDTLNRGADKTKEMESNLTVSKSEGLVDIDDVVEVNCQTMVDSGANATEVPSEQAADDTGGKKQEDLATEEVYREVTVFADPTIPARETTVAPGFHCDRCSRVLKTKASLNQHKKISCKYRDETSAAAAYFSCDVCFKTLKSKSILIKHKKRYCHTKDDSRCPLCRLWFLKGDIFKQHLQSHGITEPLLCGYCGKAFLLKEQLVSHEKLHTEDKPYPCRYCSKPFQSRGNLTAHERTHTGEKPFKCQFCEKCFKRKRNVENHERTHTQERPFQCSICGKSFHSKTSLVGHEKKHGRMELFNCRYCHKTYLTKGSRQVHERIHAGIKPYQCHLCNKRYNYNRSLKEHMRQHSGEKPYHCAFCEKSFALKCNVQKHERVHTGERPYKCKYCSRDFSQKNHANDHENIHTKKRTFYCDVCGKAFFQRASLHNHKTRHRQVKPFKCQYCEKTFINRLLVANHERTHTGEKPFECRFCEKAFNTKGYLTVHEKLHTTALQRQAAGGHAIRSEFDMMERSYRKRREKVHKCQYCEKMFCTKRNAFLHERRVHAVEKMMQTPAECPVSCPDFDSTNPLYSRSLLPLLKELHAKVVVGSGTKESDSQEKPTSLLEKLQYNLGNTEETCPLPYNGLYT